MTLFFMPYTFATTLNVPGPCSGAPSQPWIASLDGILTRTQHTCLTGSWSPFYLYKPFPLPLPPISFSWSSLLLLLLEGEKSLFVVSGVRREREKREGRGDGKGARRTLKIKVRLIMQMILVSIARICVYTHIIYVWFREQRRRGQRIQW